MKCHIAWMYWFVGIIIFCIDRITKNIALDSCLEQVHTDLPGLSFKVVINRGITWGIFNNAAQIYPLLYFFLSLLKIGAMIMIAYWAYCVHKKYSKMIFGHVLVIVGTFSNILDTIYYHGVIDFIIVSYKQYSWPVFNIADIAIVLGICMIIWQLRSLPDV